MGTKKSHLTYIGKLLMPKKKSYTNCIFSESSTNDVEGLEHSTSRTPVVPRKTTIVLSST